MKPWEIPKPKSEDPKGWKLVKKLMSSNNYKLAEEDIEFLERDETRGVRLELDYLKTEMIMKKAKIKYTIVVFGSSRIKEKKSVLKELREIEKRLKNNPKSKELKLKFEITKNMLKKSKYYEDAREFGRLVGKSGKGPGDCRVVIMTGGGPGIMEAANRGAFDVGAKSVGLNIDLPTEQFPNPYISPNLCLRVKYFAIRKLHFLNRAKALVVYPGGFGTMDELFETLTLIQTKKTDSIPIVLVGKEFWQKCINFDFLLLEGVIEYEDTEIFKMVDSAFEAWDYIIKWYQKRNCSLF